MIQHGWRLIIDGVLNLLSNVRGVQLSYIVESKDWATRQDGMAITHTLNKQKNVKARISSHPYLLRNQIIHFGSVNTFFRHRGHVNVHPSNKVVLTWFHIEQNDKRIPFIREAQRYVSCIHTSCELTKQGLCEAGVDPSKIIVIPLGVDTTLFHPVSEEEKKQLRISYGIPNDAFVIGSFQKDGVGWGDGFEPKWIKGPDIFVDVIVARKDAHPFVLLTGPARGYVKRRLTENGISFKHIYAKSYQEMARLYPLLDAYLICSRAEGGPKALLEAWASGIPVVSTDMGMVHDIQKKDVFLRSEVNSVFGLADQVRQLMSSSEMSENLVRNGLAVVQEFTWKKIAEQYNSRLYHYEILKSDFKK